MTRRKANLGRLAVFLVAAVCFAPGMHGGARAEAMPSMDEIEASGATIGSIAFEIKDVFDSSNPKERRAIHRLANKLHIDTRESTIKSQLLFRGGDKFDKKKILESERLLRANGYLFDATIRPTRYADGIVDLTVTSRDNWTLFPELSFKRSGGKSESIVGVEDTNVLGTGARISVTHENEVDRTSTRFEFSDRNLGRSWVRLDLAYSDADDGDSKLLSVNRPFHSLDARWSLGTTLFSDDRVNTLYSDGNDAAKFRQDRRFLAASHGRSAGLNEGWVRRWTVGAVLDENDFSPAPRIGLLERTPEDRDLVYPYLELQVIEDRFVTATNLNQIGRTEDLFLGATFGARVGWSDDTFGADRDALILSANFASSFGSAESTLLSVSTGVNGRVESGDLENGFASLTGRFYKRQSQRFLFYARAHVVAGHDLDLDAPVVLGGDTGLRGYPFRYRNGESSALLSLEQRYYSNFDLLRLFRVGGAVFFDAGRVWGDDVTGRDDDKVLTNVGLGLRLGSRRIGSNKIVHVDVAFPLNGDSSIDSVQFSIDAKRSF